MISWFAKCIPCGRQKKKRDQEVARQIDKENRIICTQESLQKLTTQNKEVTKRASVQQVKPENTNKIPKECPSNTPIVCLNKDPRESLKKVSAQRGKQVVLCDLNESSVRERSQPTVDLNMQLDTPSTTRSEYIMNDIDRGIDEPLQHQIDGPDLWDFYEKQEVLGEGTFAKVYKARNRITNVTCAIKIYKDTASSEGDWTALNLAEHQILVLRELKSKGSKHCIELLDYKLNINCKQYCLVLQYLPRNLKQYLKEHSNMDQFEKKNIIRQIITGLSELHAIGFIHRDLKPENILVDQFDLVKIADFGLSQKENSQHKNTKIGTIYYRAPELLLDVPTYNCSADLWSLGLIVGEIITSAKLLHTTEVDNQLKEILSIFGTDSFKKNPDFATFKRISYKLGQVTADGSLQAYLNELAREESILLLSLLQINPQDRVPCGWVIEHSDYFSQMYRQDD